MTDVAPVKRDDLSRPRANRVRIEAVRVRNFRGITDEVALSLRPRPKESAQSLLLLGENGSGKSSVIDAIELGLQARIDRHKSLSATRVPSALSFSRPETTAAIEIALSDDTSQKREVSARDGLAHLDDTRANPNFSFAAFVLRRADILRFLDTSEDERQLMFLDYVGGRVGGDWAGSREEQLAANKKRREELKSQIDSELAQLCRDQRWPVAKGFLDELGLDGFLRKRLYHGVSPQEAAQRGLRVTVKPRTLAQIKAIRELIRDFRATSPGSGPKKQGADFNKAMETLRRVLTGASESLTKAFREISTADFVERLELRSDKAKRFSLELVVHLKNGKTCSPRQVLSEANQDLLALLVFLSLLEEAAATGQAKVLVLDDVLQSVDAGIRVAAVDHIVRRFSDWQIIVTTHDRFWFAQLQSVFQRHSHPFVGREIVRWGFDTGPVVSGAAPDLVASLERLLVDGDPALICARAGLLQEELAGQLSWRLPISITRRQNDRYTLGDLWPGVQKALSPTTLGGLAEEASKWLHLRNLAGAHHNELGSTVSRQEATAYGLAVLALLKAVRCSSCFQWIERVEPSKPQEWRCRCGQVGAQTKKSATS